jgi:uncharacterized protein
MRRAIMMMVGIAATSMISLPISAQTNDLVPRDAGDQPSFDCATARTAAARLICADTELARLDCDLGATFEKQRLQVFQPDQSKFIADELSWIRDRNARCGLVGKKNLATEALAGSKPCLLGAIRERIASLGGGDQLASITVNTRPDGTITQTSSKPERTFDQSKIAALLDKVDSTRTQPKALPPPVSNQAQLRTDPPGQVCLEPTNRATCSPNRGQQGQQVPIAGKFELRKQQGYRPISFEDFKLDGKILAGENAKLILQGFYSKAGEVEILQPTGLAVAIARQYGNDSGIPLLSEDAARNVRKYFLECGNNPAAQLGCPVTVSGHADLCGAKTLLGSKTVPCLVVEDGW